MKSTLSAAGHLRLSFERSLVLEGWDRSGGRTTPRSAFQYARQLVRDLARGEPERERYVTSRVSFAQGVERFAKSAQSLRSRLRIGTETVPAREPDGTMIEFGPSTSHSRLG